MEIPIYLRDTSFLVGTTVMHGEIPVEILTTPIWDVKTGYWKCLAKADSQLVRIEITLSYVKEGTAHVTDR